MHHDDYKLAQSVLAGDERAFRAFFETYYAKVYRFVLTRLGEDRSAAEDVTQQVLHRALDRLEQFRGEAQLLTWLFAIARNEVTTWYRRNNRRQEHLILVEDHPELNAVVDSMVADPQDAPDLQLDVAQRSRLIQALLDRLPSNYGDVLEWKYVQGYTAKEIAGKLNISAQAAHSLIARSKRAFQDAYSAVNHIDMNTHEASG